MTKMTKMTKSKKEFHKKSIKNYQKLNKEQNDDQPTDQQTNIVAYRVA